jgi:hypothetical protein
VIDILRSKVPAYKGTKQPTTGGTGGLSGLWCYLFGGSATPAYRGTHDGGATAPAASRCWWSFSGSPQYKTPPTPSVPENGPCDGEPTGDEPAIGREIHLYPSE